tara:strand:+ start:279 stop:629 length:351 start_codon:yes stop_codon:yes gene_type:complete
MNNYVELGLLAILVVLLYKKPVYLQELSNNKMYLLVLIILKIYIFKTYGVTSGIISALILVVLLDTKENFCDNNKKEEFVPKIQSWKPQTFNSPCQVDIDRKIKIQSEEASLYSTH